MARPSHQWAIDLLTPDEYSSKKDLIAQYWAPFACGVVGLSGVLLLRNYRRKPVFSGIQHHILVTTLGALIGLKWAEHTNNKMAERDAVLRHYVMLHPEDFPEPERKRYKDVFEPWVPIR